MKEQIHPEKVEQDDILEDFFEDLRHDWSSAKAAALLDKDRIYELDRRWIRLSLQKRISATMALFHIKGRVRLQTREPLENLISKAEKDSNQFLVKLSRLLRPFVATGVVDVTEVDSETAWRMVAEITSESDISGRVPCFTNSQNFPWMSTVPSRRLRGCEVVQSSGVSLNLFKALDILREDVAYDVPPKVDLLIADLLQENRVNDDQDDT